MTQAGGQDPPPDHLDHGDVVAFRVEVSGRVQGVFFRASTRREARRRDLVGWVRNTRDGQVEAHLQGPEAAVEEVLDWMRGGGPPSARVAQVAVDPAAPTPGDSFDVRR